MYKSSREVRKTKASLGCGVTEPVYIEHKMSMDMGRTESDLCDLRLECAASQLPCLLASSSPE